MEWYSNTLIIDDKPVEILGVIEDSVLKITVNGDTKFSRVINMWAFQEIMPEDVFNKYEGKIRKIEQSIPNLVACGKLIL